MAKRGSDFNRGGFFTFGFFGALWRSSALISGCLLGDVFFSKKLQDRMCVMIIVVICAIGMNSFYT